MLVETRWDAMTAALEKEEVPSKILDTLPALRNKFFGDEPRFLEALGKLLGKETLEQCQSIILKYAEPDEFYGKLILEHAHKSELSSYILTEDALENLPEDSTSPGTRNKLSRCCTNHLTVNPIS